VVIAVGLISMAVRGLNWGTDFTGGSVLHYDIHQSYSLDDVRNILNKLDLKDFEAKKAGDDEQVLILRTIPLGAEQQNEITNELKQKWHNIELVRTDKVDAIIGKELQRKAVIALILANIGMLIYISFRFEFKSALAAIVALIHDVLILISLFAVFRLPLDITFIAALLTIVGYSINDTIVIFDRIRENLKVSNKVSFDVLADKSVSQTMSRTINTSLTTLITITMLFLFGGETIKDFALALIVGIVSGTYSSIFIAGPIWSLFRKNTNPVKV
ncbi:MAG: protein translocase subunit SecF, partial [Thermoanaerobacterales bacterium]|nr:protein translocase subunit SecF [Thermoanaerobacterales bacterium]